jgi:hypothetical protein
MVSITDVGKQTAISVVNMMFIDECRSVSVHILTCQLPLTFQIETLITTPLDCLIRMANMFSAELHVLNGAFHNIHSSINPEATEPTLLHLQLLVMAMLGVTTKFDTAMS